MVLGRIITSITDQFANLSLTTRDEALPDRREEEISTTDLDLPSKYADLLLCQRPTEIPDYVVNGAYTVLKNCASFSEEMQASAAAVHHGNVDHLSFASFRDFFRLMRLEAPSQTSRFFTTVSNLKRCPQRDQIYDEIIRRCIDGFERVVHEATPDILSSTTREFCFTSLSEQTERLVLAIKALSTDPTVFEGFISRFNIEKYEHLKLLLCIVNSLFLEQLLDLRLCYFNTTLTKLAPYFRKNPQELFRILVVLLRISDFSPPFKDRAKLVIRFINSQCSGYRNSDINAVFNVFGRELLNLYSLSAVNSASMENLENYHNFWKRLLIQCAYSHANEVYDRFLRRSNETTKEAFNVAAGILFARNSSLENGYRFLYNQTATSITHYPSITGSQLGKCTQEDLGILVANSYDVGALIARFNTENGADLLPRNPGLFVLTFLQMLGLKGESFIEGCQQLDLEKQEYLYYYLVGFSQEALRSAGNLNDAQIAQFKEEMQVFFAAAFERNPQMILMFENPHRLLPPELIIQTVRNCLLSLGYGISKFYLHLTTAKLVNYLSNVNYSPADDDLGILPTLIDLDRAITPQEEPHLFPTRPDFKTEDLIHRSLTLFPNFVDYHSVEFRNHFGVHAFRSINVRDYPGIDAAGWINLRCEPKLGANTPIAKTLSTTLPLRSEAQDIDIKDLASLASRCLTFDLCDDQYDGFSTRDSINTLIDKVKGKTILNLPPERDATYSVIENNLRAIIHSVNLMIDSDVLSTAEKRDRISSMFCVLVLTADYCSAPYIKDIPEAAHNYLKEFLPKDTSIGENASTTDRVINIFRYAADTYSMDIVNTFHNTQVHDDDRDHHLHSALLLYTSKSIRKLPIDEEELAKDPCLPELDDLLIEKLEAYFRLCYDSSVIARQAELMLTDEIEFKIDSLKDPLDRIPLVYFREDDLLIENAPETFRTQRAACSRSNPYIDTLRTTASNSLLQMQQAKEQKASTVDSLLAKLTRVSNKSTLPPLLRAFANSPTLPTDDASSDIFSNRATQKRTSLENALRSLRIDSKILPPEIDSDIDEIKQLQKTVQDLKSQILDSLRTFIQSEEFFCASFSADKQDLLLEIILPDLDLELISLLKASESKTDDALEDSLLDLFYERLLNERYRLKLELITYQDAEMGNRQSFNTIFLTSFGYLSGVYTS